MIIPRPYQNMAVKAALEGLGSSSKCALVVMATGLGKTITAAMIAQNFGAKKILFLVHNNFILEHAIIEFKLVFPKRVKTAVFNGISKDGSNESDIVFATWQTMGRHIGEWSNDHFDLVIVDEAHHAEADTYRPVVEYFDAPKLGLTATPDREDKADIRRIFGPEVFEITLEEAIARGWLPRIEYHVITDESLNEESLQEIAAEIRQGKKRFTMAEVNRRIFIRKRDKEVAKIINGYEEKAVVFCASISHAERMAKWLEMSQTFHSGKGKSQGDTWRKNQAVLDGLENGKVLRVCAVNAFNEGVNVPSVGMVAFCRATNALTIFSQQLGRGLRPGKDKLIVLDFVGNLERIQLVLGMMNRISDLHEQYTSREEIEREGYVREKFEVSGSGFEFTFSDKIVDLMEVIQACNSDFYPTWQEASEAAIALGIRTGAEYRNLYKEDSRLPGNLYGRYEDFPGSKIFFGTAFYPTWQEARIAAIKLGISDYFEYLERYKEDPRLPSSPAIKYSSFPGFSVFLGKKTANFYPTWQEASKAAIALGFKSSVGYRDHYKRDPRLPSQPQQTYKNFPGWNKFLGKE